MSTTIYPHIEIDAEGTARIAETTTKVIEIVLDVLAHHWHAEDIQRQYPYLTLGQIHGALAYYYDHQQELDREIDRRWRNTQELKARLADPTLRDRLRQAGHLPTHFPA